MAKEMYGAFVMTGGEWWDYPLLVADSKDKCVLGFCDWLSKLGPAAYTEVSLKVMPVTITAKAARKDTPDEH